MKADNVDLALVSPAYLGWEAHWVARRAAVGGLQGSAEVEHARFQEGNSAGYPVAHELVACPQPRAHQVHPAAGGPVHIHRLNRHTRQD